MNFLLSRLVLNWTTSAFSKIQKNAKKNYSHIVHSLEIMMNWLIEKTRTYSSHLAIK
jgi:hypothetical protein